MAVNCDPKKINQLLKRGVAEVIDKTSLRRKLLSGKRLHIKHGIDPTGPRIHLGRSAPLLKLADFQELGHKIVLIIGDFTGLVGDTSDKTAERPMLDRQTVAANMADYTDQIKRIFDINQAEIHYNSQWLGKLDFYEISKMADLFSVHEFINRENIKLRLDAGKRVSLREVIYPLMQGYDSVAVEADVEVGGTDQRFNLLAGRKIQPLYNQKPQDILMNSLINGLDGEKMSTSRGNIIAILDSPSEQYGKIMSMGDEMIIPYFELLTRLPERAIGQFKKFLHQGGNPRDLKMKLARQIVEIYHGKAQALEAEIVFVNQFQKGELPKDIATVIIHQKSSVWRRDAIDPICEDIPALLVEAKLSLSKSEARRLIEQQAVRLDGALITDWRAKIALYSGMLVQVGKRKFARLKIIN